MTGLHFQPVHSPVSDQDLIEAGGLAVETGISSGAGYVLQQPSHTPSAARLFICHQRQRQLTRDGDLQLVDQQQADQRSHRAGLHVAHPAAQDLAVPALSGVGIERPVLTVSGRKLIEVTIENEIAAVLCTYRVGDEALESGPGLVHLGRQPLRLEVSRQERDALGRGARGVVGGNADNIPQQLRELRHSGVNLPQDFCLQLILRPLILHLFHEVVLQGVAFEAE